MKKIIKFLLPNRILIFLSQHFHLEKQKWVNKKFTGKRLNHNILNVTSKTYENYKSYREAEHQIGRFLNMQKILKEIEENEIPGDLVEFGTWQGQGLILFDLALSKKTHRNLIGIDSFEGLPESSTIWKKGDFSNTSLAKVNEKLKDNIKFFNKVILIQGWFNNPSVANELYQKTQDVSIFHLDADLGSSTAMALEIIEKYLNNRKNPLYLLFDDWGCHSDEVPEAFYSWLKVVKLKYKIEEQIFSTTNLSRYYKLNFTS
jgi:hypothetical protein